MDKYMVRQPIRDKNNNIFAYELIYQIDKMGAYNNGEDFAAADTISSLLMQNLETIVGDKMIFITFTPNLLFKNIPKVFNAESLVIQIEDNVIIHPLSNTILNRFITEGYGVAVNNFQFNPRYFSILDSADYIKINFAEESKNTIENLIKMSKGFNKKCIITEVNTKEDYNFIMNLDIDYFQGNYIAEDNTIKIQKTDYMQGNFFQLIVEITKDEPDLDAVEEIISRDAGLTFALLKVVNSAYFALKNKATTITQALTFLGLVQLKRWVYLLSLGSSSNEQSEEVLKKSFLRANFCAELHKYISGMPINKSEAYLMGMLSTLDSLVDAPLSEILEEIYVDPVIKEALLERKGIAGKLYEFVLKYETANWPALKKLANELSIPKDVISQIYFDCVEEVNNTWKNAVTNFSKED